MFQPLFNFTNNGFKRCVCFQYEINVKLYKKYIYCIYSSFFLNNKMMKIPYCISKQNMSLCTTDEQMNTGTKKKTVSNKMLYSEKIRTSSFKPMNPTSNRGLRPY
jgi:hypothetical protein